MRGKTGIRKPFFEIGPKAYVYGKDAVEIAIAADKASRKYDVDIIFTALCTDIDAIVTATRYLKVFSQHMDSLKPGRGIGAALPEAIKEAGACGTMLNHTERPLQINEINKCIKRAHEVGLATLVCADTVEEACAVAQLGPDMILAESPDLIGGGERTEEDKRIIQEINEKIAKIDPGIMVMHSAGIKNGKDVYETVYAGADGTGSTSGIIKANDPCAMVDEMIAAVRAAYDDRMG